MHRRGHKVTVQSHAKQQRKINRAGQHFSVSAFQEKQKADLLKC